MSNLLKQLWNDDQGAVISTELVLVVGILVFGIIPGLVALRNSVNSSLATMGNVLTRITPSFTFSGYAIGAQGGASTIAIVGGLQLNYSIGNQFSAVQVAPALGTYTYVLPAP